MQLWKKLTVVSIGIIMIVMSILMVVMTEVQVWSMRQAAKENTYQVLESCVRNVRASIRQQKIGLSERTQRVLVQYLYAEYVEMARSETVGYSLVTDGEYVFNNNPYDLISILPPVRGEDPLQVLRHKTSEGRVLWVGMDSMMDNEQEYYIYVCVDVTENEQQILKLRWLGIGMILAASVITAILTTVFIRKMMKPVTALTETATAIAEGGYHLRSRYRSKDEIGQLAKSFDEMAAAIEEQIRSLQEEVERRQQLLGSLSHEIRTPITAIIGYAETLLQMPLNEEQKRECVLQIAASGKRAENLSSKMMELIGLAQMQTLEKRKIAVESLVEAIQEEYGGRLRIDWDVDELYGDETLLYSLLINLIRNGIRASKENDPIEVSIMRNTADKVYIIVEDQGCGIPEEHLDKITEPFYRVDKARSRKAGGAGLGLSICQKIAQYHEGSISIVSEVGKGTIVTVEITS